MADDAAPEGATTEGTSPDPLLDIIVRRDFPTGFRGFDPGHVIAHLEAVAARFGELADQEQAARRRVRELEAELARAAAAPREGGPGGPPAAVDEATVMEAL